MTQQPKLAPHDADLVEADARQLFEEVCASEIPPLALAWEDTPAWVQRMYLAYAENPWAFIGLRPS